MKKNMKHTYNFSAIIQINLTVYVFYVQKSFASIENIEMIWYNGFV